MVFHGLAGLGLECPKMVEACVTKDCLECQTMRNTLDYYGDVARLVQGMGWGAFAEYFLEAYIHADNNHAILLLPVMMVIAREYGFIAHYEQVLKREAL